MGVSDAHHVRRPRAPACRPGRCRLRTTSKRTAAPPLPRRLHLRPASGHARMPGGGAARLPKAHPSDYLYLVGDIVDGWQLRRRWYWPQAHNDVVQKLLRSARKGCRVIYVPGNHDEFARQFVGHQFGGIEVLEEAVHVTADGRRLWVIHGDYFDGVVQCAKWLAYLGDNLYEFTLKLNRHLNRLRGRLGLPYWSLSAYLKQKVKNALNYVADFEVAVAREARRRGHAGRGLRPHPPRRDARHRRHPVLQRRRLGGKPHGAGGALRRPAGTGALDAVAEAAGLADAARAACRRSHEDRTGDRCLAAPGQRRCHHAGRTGAGA